MSGTRSAEPPVLLKLSSPADVVEAVPHLLGFHPAQSLLAIGLSGPRRRLGIKLRVDLPPRDGQTPVVELVVGHLARAGADTALLVVYTDEEARDGALPWATLIDELRAALEKRGLALADALLVQHGRWRSYHCMDPACCPPDSLPVRGPTDGSRVGATLAYAGMAAMPSREELVASLRAPRSVARVGAQQALDRVAAGLLQRRAAGEPQSALRQEARALLQATLERYAEAHPALEADAAARLVLALVDVPLRDEVCAMALGPDGEALRSLLTDLVRRAVPPDEAPVVTVLGAVA